MQAAAVHHVGLVVDDIEHAGRFYRQAFGARWRMTPVTFGPPGAAGVFEGPEDLSFHTGMLELSGVLLELFAFNGKSSPDWLTGQPVLVPHLALQVDDVPACLERVQAAGGSRVWPEVMQVGRSQALYVRDPDGNAIELLGSSADDFVEDLLAIFPDARP